MAPRLYLSVVLSSAVAFTGCAQRSAVLHPPAPVTTRDNRRIHNATDAGEGDYLLRAMRQRVIEHPDDLAARLELAHAYESRGVPELALEHYRLAADRFLQSAEAHLELARSLDAARLPAEAVRVLQEFLHEHPQRAVRYESWLGILNDDAGDWKAGETAHREAIRMAQAESEDRDYLHNNLGYCLLKQGRKAEAVAEFRAALSLNRGSETARDNLAEALADNPKSAILHWQSVNEPAAAHSNLAAVLIEQGKYAQARAEIARALGYNRTHSAALANLKLVSELDGKPAIIPAAQARKSMAARWKERMAQWFAAPPSDTRGKPESNPQTASR